MKRDLEGIMLIGQQLQCLFMLEIKKKKQIILIMTLSLSLSFSCNNKTDIETLKKLKKRNFFFFFLTQTNGYKRGASSW